MSLESFTQLVHSEQAQNVQDNREQLSLVIVGHVDHGKSTVIGRLLYDTGSLPEGRLESVKAACEYNSKPFEFAFLLDALKDERAQGITIDVSRSPFKTAKRDYTIIDAPGHIEFLKNMITGAAHAQAALLVIDAKEGVQENSRRHGYLLAALGVKQFYVVVNKMDLVEYDKSIFTEIRKKFEIFLEEIGAKAKGFIPLSAFHGENLLLKSNKMLWYDGLTLIEALDDFVVDKKLQNQSLRAPVQGVYKFTAQGDDRRIIAGKVESGSLSVGDEVVFYPSGKRSVVASIENFPPIRQETVTAGNFFGVTLSSQIYVTRGETLAKVGETPPIVASLFKASLFWMGGQPLVKDKVYKLKLATQEAIVRIAEIVKIIDASTLATQNKQVVEKHEVAEVIIEARRPLAFDHASDNETFSRFVLVDEYEISGGGIVLTQINKQKEAVFQPVSAEERAAFNQITPRVVWICGAGVAERRELAGALERRLFDLGKNPIWLDSEEFRAGLSPELDYSEPQRVENIRRIAETAHLLAKKGFLILITAQSPLVQFRQKARKIIGEESFYEININNENANFELNKYANKVLSEINSASLGSVLFDLL